MLITESRHLIFLKHIFFRSYILAPDAVILVFIFIKKHIHIHIPHEAGRTSVV